MKKGYSKVGQSKSKKQALKDIKESIISIDTTKL